MRIDFLHHAYCFEGDAISLKKSLIDILEKELEFKTKGNPDFWLGEFDAFGIDDSRQVSQFQLGKAVGGDKKVIVLTLNSITHEAQNALLKTLEEPTENTHFFIILPSVEILLPTVKSRMVILPKSNLRESTMSDLGKEFLRASKKKRLEIVKKIIGDRDKDDEKKSKSRREAIELLNQLEKLIYETRPPLRSSTPKWRAQRDVLANINKFRGYLNDRSPNLKMILEHLALVTPR